jgi:hypothetical protein
MDSTTKLLRSFCQALAGSVNVDRKTIDCEALAFLRAMAVEIVAQIDAEGKGEARPTQKGAEA